MTDRESDPLERLAAAWSKPMTLEECYKTETSDPMIKIEQLDGRIAELEAINKELVEALAAIGEELEAGNDVDAYQIWVGCGKERVARATKESG